MDDQLKRTIRDLLSEFDDGVRFCTGTTSAGKLVWRGSFLAYMEQLRSALPPEDSEEATTDV